MVEDGGERKRRGDWLLEGDNVRSQPGIPRMQGRQAFGVKGVGRLWMVVRYSNALALLGRRDLLENKRDQLLE